MHISFKFATIITIIIFIFQLSTGCGGGDRLDTYLDRAERIMDEAPDSAHAILADSITTQLLASASERQAALHALLLTQSEFKIYQPSDNDSLISTAVEYFENADDRPHLMKSLYYKARICNNNENYSDAMNSAMRARAMAKMIEDNFWQARCDDVIAKLFSSFYHSKESINYGKEAAELYKKSGNILFYIYTLSDQAIRYNHLKQYENCQAVIDTILNLFQNPQVICDEFRQSILADISSTAQLMYSTLGEYEKAEQMGDSVLKYEDHLLNTAIEHAIIADVKIRLGRINEANEILKNTFPKLRTTRDSIFYYNALSHYYEKKGDTEATLKATKKSLELYSQIFDIVTTQSVMYAQRDYYSEEMIRIAQIATRNRLLLILALFSTIFLIITSILIYRNRLSKKNMDISKKMTEIILLSKTLQQTNSENETLNKKLSEFNQLSSIISTQNSKIEELSENLISNSNRNEKLSSMVQILLQGRFAQLNTIITEYAAQEENETNYLAFYKNIKHEIDKFKRPENIQEIERMVDDCLDGIISKIRTQIPSMREKDVTLLALTLAGLNARAIGLFLGIHPNYTYRRKKQLIKIIADSSAPNAPEIVEILSRY